MKYFVFESPVVRLLTKDEFFKYRDEKGTLVNSDFPFTWFIDGKTEDGMNNIISSSLKILLSGASYDCVSKFVPVIEFAETVQPGEKFVAYGFIWRALDEHVAIRVCGNNDRIRFKIDQELSDFELEEMTCQACGALIESGTDVVVYEGKRFAEIFCDESCLSESDDYFRCADCGDIVADCNRYYIEDEEKNVCLSCFNDNGYFQCEDCGAFYSSDYLSDIEDRALCNDCRANYVICDGCGRSIYADDAYYDDDTDCYYCENCWYDHERVDGLLCYHDDRADYGIFHYVDENGDGHLTYTPDKNEKYLGFEDEIDDGSNGTDLVEDINNKFDYVYCMHDGSLSERGIELITQPATLEWHEKYGRYDDLFDMCKDYDYESDHSGTTGLHVHVSRSFFGEGDTQQFNIAKLILLMNKFWDNRIVPFTRRSSYELDRWASKNYHEDVFETDTERDVAQKVTGSANSSGRYKAINTQNYRTIEFRIFKGTLDYNTLIATLQFVDYVCDYAKNHTLQEIDDVKWQDVFRDCKHKELMEYIMEKTNFDKEFYAERSFITKQKMFQVCTWDELEARFHSWDDYCIETPRFCFTAEMKRFSGYKCYYSNGKIKLIDADGDTQIAANDFTWVREMLKEVEE